MTKVVNAFKRFFNWIDNCAMVMYMFATILVTVNVFTRYVLSHTIFGNEELSTYAVLLMAFIVFPVVEARNQHLRVDIIDAICKNELVMKIIYIVRGLITICAFGVVIKAGIKVTQTAFMYASGTATLHLPKWIIFTIVLICFVLVIINWLVVLIFNKRRPLEK